MTNEYYNPIMLFLFDYRGSTFDEIAKNSECSEYLVKSTLEELLEKKFIRFANDKYALVEKGAAHLESGGLITFAHKNINAAIRKSPPLVWYKRHTKFEWATLIIAIVAIAIAFTALMFQIFGNQPSTK